MSGIEKLTAFYNDPKTQRLVTKYRRHYKDGFILTLETGCLVFTSLMIYYSVFMSSEGTRALDWVVIASFLLGALIYFASSSLFSLSDDTWSSILKRVNKWLFMGLSFIPGLYFAFQYEGFILRFYLVVHIVTSAYFLYKRYKEFELEPFVAGLGLSVVLGIISPSIRFFFGLFGSGWFVGTCQSVFGGLVDLGLAVSFFLRLPEKYLPANMLCGLKVVKYFMFLLSWQSWFILMVFTTWRNLGAGTRTLIQVYKHEADVGGNETTDNTPKSEESRSGNLKQN